MPKERGEKTVAMYVRVPVHTKQQLKRLARKRHRTMTKMVAQVLADHLEVSREQEVADIDHRIDQLQELRRELTATSEQPGG